MTERPVVVLHVLEALSYGTSRHVVDLVQHTAGVEHHVAVPPGRSTGITDTRAADAIRSAGGHVHVIDMRRLPVHPVNVRAVWALTRLARRLQVDVVHGHSAIGGALARVLPVRAGRVYTPNGFAQGRVSLWIERLLGRRTDRLIAVSASEARFATEQRLVPEARQTVIPNGVELELPAPTGALRAALGIGPDVPLIGTVGRLDPQKAPFDLLTMWRQVADIRPDAHFVLVGDGSLAAHVDAAARDLPRFTRLGYVENVAAAMQDLDVFVLLSRYEGGPYVALEAARAGVPLVLTDVVGNRDVLVPQESGVLVPSGRPHEAAQAVLGLLEDDRRRTALAQGMRRRLAERFDVTAQAARHAELYRELVSHRA
jgi:glycosyltransferase involved in cell wall biosynthesis